MTDQEVGHRILLNCYPASLESVYLQNPVGPTSRGCFKTSVLTQWGPALTGAPTLGNLETGSTESSILNN